MVSVAMTVTVTAFGPTNKGMGWEAVPETTTWLFTVMVGAGLLVVGVRVRLALE